MCRFGDQLNPGIEKCKITSWCGPLLGKGGGVKFDPYNPITHSIHVGHIDI